MTARMVAAFFLSLALTGCSSAPTRYFTLIKAPTHAPSSVHAQPFQFELQPLRIPVQVDQPGLVVRQGDGRLLVLESALWASPLADELHDALAAELEAGLGDRELSGVPRDRQKPLVSIRVDVRRFESLPGEYVWLDVVWSLRFMQKAMVQRLVCSSSLREAAPTDLDGMVLAHQRAIERLAKAIAPVVQRLGMQGNPACP